MNFTIKELNELIYSLGISASKGLMCDKELNVSLLNKVYDELNRKLAEEEEQDYLSVVEQDEQRYGDSHYVSNEEADEEYQIAMMLKGVMNELEVVKKPKGVTQAILDMVERQGDATYTEMNDFYKKTFGSNSFSHILKALRIPYKNRPTRRYLVKTANGNYEVRVANSSNWVVADNCYKTFNEAPYGR